MVLCHCCVWFTAAYLRILIDLLHLLCLFVSPKSLKTISGLGHAKAVQIENMQSLICTIQKWELQWSSGPFDGLIFFLFWEVFGSRNWGCKRVGCFFNIAYGTEYGNQQFPMIERAPIYMLDLQVYKFSLWLECNLHHLPPRLFLILHYLCDKYWRLLILPWVPRFFLKNEFRSNIWWDMIWQAEIFHTSFICQGVQMSWSEVVTI